MKNSIYTLMYIYSKRVLLALLLFFLSCSIDQSEVVSSNNSNNISKFNIESIYKNSDAFSKIINFNLQYINSNIGTINNENYDFTGFDLGDTLAVDSIVIVDSLKIINYHKFDVSNLFSLRVDTILIIEPILNNTLTKNSVKTISSNFFINSELFYNYKFYSKNDSLYSDNDTITIEINNIYGNYTKIAKCLDKFSLSNFNNLDFVVLELINDENRIIQKNNLINFINDSLYLSIFRVNDSVVDSIYYNLKDSNNFLIKSYNRANINFKDSLFYISITNLMNDDKYIYKMRSFGDNYSDTLVYVQFPPYFLDNDSLYFRPNLILKDSSQYNTKRVYYTFLNNQYQLKAEDFVKEFANGDALIDSTRIDYTNSNIFTYKNSIIYSDSSNEFFSIQINRVNQSYLGIYNNRENIITTFKNSDNNLYIPITL